MKEVVIPERTRIVGGSGEGTKKVYISKDVYREIFSFSKDKNVCESGGVLLGNIVSDEHNTYIIINAFIEAKHSEGTSNSITFTKDTWNYIDKEKEKYPEFDIVGWMHTNPDTGCMATEYDIFFQTHMFEKDDIVAYIVDPVQIVEAFYFLEDGKLKKFDGFYVFMEDSEKHRRKQKNHKEDKKLLKQEPDTKGSEIKANNLFDEDRIIKEELNNVLKGEDIVAEKQDDNEGHSSRHLSDNMDISKISVTEHISLKMKILISILTILVIALTIGISVIALRISQLEKDIENLYRNDEVIAKYINEGEEMAE